MTTSRHTYAGSLPGGVTASISEGEISLDAGNAPHVTGDIVLPVPGEWVNEAIPHPLEPGHTILVPRWVPDPATLAALDPRRSPRVRVAATDGGESRVFNLGVRERPVAHSNGTLTLTLASDEAILEDYAPLQDDNAVWAGSVGHVAQYVLGRAGVPANLEPNPRALNVPATTAPYLGRYQWLGPMLEGTNAPDGTNLVTMARFWANETGTIAGRGIDSYGNPEIPVPGTAGAWVESPVVSPGDTIAVSRFVRWHNLTWTGAPVSLAVRFHDGAGHWIGGLHVLDVAPNEWPAGYWRRLGGVVVVPAGAQRLVVHVRLGDAFVTPATALDMTGVQTEVNDEVSDFKDFALAITSADAPLPADRAADLLIWQAGQSALEFLHPIVQAVGLRLVCDERRQWTLRDEGYTAPGSVSIRHGINLIDDGSVQDTISRDSGDWYDAAVIVHKWTDAAGNQQRQIDSYAAPGVRRPLVRRFDRNTPFPGSGFAQYAVRRAQGRGRGVTASAVSNWSCHAEQPIAIVLEGAPTQTGLTQRVTFDLSTDRMTITTRTTDTPGGAIDLLPGTINALAGTIDGL